MNPRQLRALQIIEDGEPFVEGWSDEGDAESGPMGGVTYGYRDGEDSVQLSRNGGVLLYAGNLTFSLSHGTSPYTGINAMIRDHLRAVQRNADRNGLEFVITGKRPTTGRYSLDQIMAREAQRGL